MSLRGGLQFWRALRRYKNDKNLEASLLTELLRTEIFTYVDHKLGDEPK